MRLLRRPLFLIAVGSALLTLASSCKDEVTEPVCELCGEVRVRTAYSDYRPSSTIVFTVTNITGAAVRYDWCSVFAAGRSRTEVPFATDYRADRRCGSGAGTAEVLSHMRELAPGAGEQDSVRLQPGAFQGEYRVQVWLVSADGTVLPGNPVISNSIDVYPGAPR